MKRHRFSLTSIKEFDLKNSLLDQSEHYPYFSFLDSNSHTGPYHRFDWIVAYDAASLLEPQHQSFEQLKDFHNQHRDWLFGHLSYELKNELEKLNTSHADRLGFAALLFFVPNTVVHAVNGLITVESIIHSTEEEFLSSLKPGKPEKPASAAIELKPRTSRSEYLGKVASLKEHLQYGNIYEVNYCVEFGGNAASFDTRSAFKKLNASAQAPFSAFYKNEDQYVLCSSPERYLQKKGDVITSQPIKGTIRRAQDPALDEVLKKELLDNEKERSENVMITDLVRNDLSRTAARASVKVTELFGIYTFNTVHQMISTVQSRLDEKFHFSEVLKTTFPMGSMTGAPKPRAMELIDEHENFARNLYSGAIGYITPEGDFDFNVVIRSIFYNGSTGYISARVGSAITIHCQAENEYEECLLKAENLFRCLE